MLKNDDELDKDSSEKITKNIENEVTDKKEMSFTAHLEELRQAIIISISALVLSSGLCFYFYNKLIDLLTAPLTNNIKNVELIFTSPAEAFTATLRACIITGLIIASPVILNRLYWFISPGLTKKEKKYSFPLLFLSYFLFIIGILFSYYLMLPFGVKFLVEFAPTNIKPMISIGNYISFSTTLVLATGLIFQLPLLLIFLSFVKILNAEKLIKNRRFAFLGSFVVGAIVTPSVDMITQCILAFALYSLYEISIFIIKRFEKNS
ncbi:MAG: twin-arginine translocase subunit TatC [Candidatus Sericytochromatia bacterium]